MSSGTPITKSGGRYGSNAWTLRNSRNRKLLDAELCELHRRLTFAAQQGDAAELRAVLETGIDINEGTETWHGNGQTALHWACDMGHPNCVKILLLGGAGLDAQDKYGRTPANRAELMGRLDVRAMLDEWTSIQTVLPLVARCAVSIRTNAPGT